MGKLEDIWDKWGDFVEDLKVNPGDAIKQAAVDNLKWILPIVGIIAGILILKLVRRGR
jgi:hypothetical protein